MINCKWLIVNGKKAFRIFHFAEIYLCRKL